MCKSQRGILIFSALFVVAICGGCYTVIKHPRPARDDGQAAADKVTFGSECQSCHTGGAWTHTGIAVPPPRPALSSNWYYYYETPWWYDYYASKEEAEQAAQSQRPFDRRKMTQPSDGQAASAPAALPAPTSGALARPTTTNDGSDSQDAPAAADDGKRSGKRDTNANADSSKRRTRKPNE